MERSFTAVLMGPASPSAGAAMGIKTAKTAVMKQTAKASKECVIPRQSLPAKAQVSLPGVPQNQLVCTDLTFISCTDLQLYFLLVFCVTYMKTVKFCEAAGDILYHNVILELSVIFVSCKLSRMINPACFSLHGAILCNISVC